MPCNTIITNTVELEQKYDNDLMLKALQKRFGYVDHNLGAAAGATRWFKVEVAGRPVYLREGRLESSLNPDALQTVTGRVKQAYAEQAMLSSAKRFGWATKETTKAAIVSVRRG